MPPSIPLTRSAGDAAGAPPLHRALGALSALARVPLALVPERVHSRALCTALNRLLSPQLRDGELDFLDGRSLAIDVRDLGTRFRITLRGGWLRPADDGAAHLTFIGNALEFALLATREEDPDTLFFQRRLHLDGDAELGLAVKNFLDALEFDTGRLPAPLAAAARRVAPRLRGTQR